MARKKLNAIKKQAQINQEKYLFPPSYELIKKYVYGELKISMLRFERFFGIPEGTMKQISFHSHKSLAPKFWHLIYEKVKPKYGVGYYNPETLQVQHTTTKKPKVKKEKTIPKEDAAVNSLLLSKLKEQLQ